MPRWMLIATTCNVIAVVANLATLSAVGYLAYKLFGNHIECTPPDGYVEQYYRARTYNRNLYYLRDQ